MSNLRIAFILYSSRDVNTIPSVTNALRILGEYGYFVDVYFNEKMTTLLKLPNVNFIRVEGSDLASYSFNAIDIISKSNYGYDHLFTFDYECLLIGHLSSKKKRKEIPVIYFSLELTHRYYRFILLKRFIKAIIKYDSKGIVYNALAMFTSFKIQMYDNKFIKLFVVQDIERGKLLKKEFPFAKRIVCVPNSYIGYNDDSSSYAYNMFGIPAQKKILLYSGGVEKGFDLGLFEMCEYLNDDYVLLFNSYSRDGYLDDLLIQYKKYINNGNLFVNMMNLDEENYDKLVRSAYMGIVWHQKEATSVPNIYYIGFSSGKFTKYLSCGKPVIVPDYFFPNSTFVEQKKLGVVCKSAYEIPIRVESIRNEYSEYKKCIKEFYAEHLEFRKRFENVISVIRASIGNL